MIKNKRIGLIITAHNETDFLETNFRIIRPYIDKIVISIAENSFKAVYNSNDNECKNIANNIKDESTIIRENYFKNLEEQRNDALDQLPDCDLVIVLEDNQILSSESIIKLIHFAIENSSTNIFRVNVNRRIKNMKLRAMSYESAPIIINNRVGLRFSGDNDLAGERYCSAKVPENVAMVYDFLFVGSTLKKIMDRLKDNYPIVEHPKIVQWISEVFPKISIDSVNFHPMTPELFQYAIKEPVNDEIIDFFKKYGNPEILELK